MKRNAFVFMIITAVFLGMTAVSGFGSPKNYWQQDVSYEIHVTLNTQKNTLTGKERLVYKNNSPDVLNYVWFHTYPNAFKNNTTIYAKEMAARGSSKFYFSGPKDRGYVNWKSITADGTPVKWRYKPGEITEAKVFLAKPLKPGESITFEIAFFVKIPLVFSRLGHNGRHMKSPNGTRRLSSMTGKAGIRTATTPQESFTANSAHLMCGSHFQKTWLWQPAEILRILPRRLPFGIP